MPRLPAVAAALPFAAALAFPLAAAPAFEIATFANPATFGFDGCAPIALARTEIDPNPLQPATFTLGGVVVTVTAQGGGRSADGTFPFYCIDGTLVTATFDYGPERREDSPTGRQGTWGPERGSFVWNPDDGARVRFTFSEPVGQVAGFVNTRLDGIFDSALTFVALGAGGEELESFRLTSNPFGPGEITDAGGFRGFSRTTLDITAFELRNGFFGLDNLTIGTFGLGGPIADPPAPIPLPAGLPLLLGALGVLALVRGGARMRRV